MGEAEQEQPEHPAVVDRGARAAGGLGPLDDQQRARAEQEGEEAAHLAVDEDEVEEPGGQVGGDRPSPKAIGLR